MFDLIIKNGFVIDGAGVPGYLADVGIHADRIACIGELPPNGARILNAEGCVVSPGFIDIHSHTDESVFANPSCESKVTQGVTTEVSGNCGESAAPRGGRQDPQDFQGWVAEHSVTPGWNSMREFLSELEKLPMTVNFATCVGHGTVRSAAMGCEDREPTEAEMAEMRRLIDEAMQAGALGLSSGLIYPPGCYADTGELIDLCRVVARYGGLYTTHLRSEREHMLQALDEAVSIGREAGVGVQVSHHKTCGQRSRGMVRESLAMIDAACRQGLDIMADQYPYAATAIDLNVLLPRWAHDGGTPAMLARLKDPAQRRRIRDQVLSDAADGWIADSGAWDTVIISFVKQEKNRPFEGMSLSGIAAEMGKHPADALLDLLLEEQGSVGMIHFVIDPDDVVTVMTHPASVIGSDATARATSGPLSRGKPHPRAYGTFSRVLGKYVREDGVLSLEEAVAKMTGRTAKRLGLEHRGLVAPGYYADLMVFDPDEVCDTATFAQPHSPSRGIRYVLVNGRVVIDEGSLVRPEGHGSGRVLRRGTERVAHP